MIASIVSAGVLVKSPPVTMSVLSAPTYVVPLNVGVKSCVLTVITCLGVSVTVSLASSIAP